MKLSLKFREDTNHQNPLLRAKVPVTILGLPFLSGIVAGDSSDLSFSLRSNFSSGPSLSLSYHPTVTTSNFPFSFSLKSGVGFFGSPHDSPLIFSASFNLFSPSTNPASFHSLNPTFFLQLKPQFGNFSLSKSVSSDKISPIQSHGHPRNGDLGSGSVSNVEIDKSLSHGLVGVEKTASWRDLKRESSILSEIFVAARTSLPLTKRAVVNFKWGVNFPPEEGSKPGLPWLVVNKISLERVEEVKKVEESKRIEEAKTGDLEFFKGMCSWMKTEMDELQKENREMKQALEGLRLPGHTSRGRGDDRTGGGKRNVASPASGGSGEFERWRSRKGDANAIGEENGHKEWNKSANRMSEVESELQKAIKSASS